MYYMVYKYERILDILPHNTPNQNGNKTNAINILVNIPPGPPEHIKLNLVDFFGLGKCLE